MYKPISLKRTWFSLLLILIACALVLSARTLAQNQDDQAASGLQISPTRSELAIKRGSSSTITINLKNVTGGGILATPEIDDFVSDNDSGTPKLITDSNERSPFTIKDFISKMTDIPMKSGESKTIKIPVNVPADQPPGGYFGVIRFIAKPIDNQATNSGRQINLTASLGHIVLVNVPGNVKEQLQLVSFKAEKNGNPGTVFASSPDGMALGLRNTGNSFSKPFGTVTVKNFRGKQVFQYEVNNTDPRGNVLPDSTRVFHDKIQSVGSSPGRYTAVASISYGAGGEVLVSQIHFWVIPNWLRIFAVLVVVAILFAIFLAYKRLRSQEEKYKTRR